MNNEELKIIISAETAKLKQGTKEAKQEIENLSKKGKVSMKDFLDGVGKAGDFTKKALGGVGLAVAGAATALLSLSSTTAEYRENQAKLATAFETAGSSADTAKNTYNELYRVLGDGGQATEAANHLAKLTTSEQGLSEWTNICQGVYATFGDSLPIEGLTEAANETAKVGLVTGGLADALNWAGVSEDAFNDLLSACNNEAEREKLIRETLNGLYSEASANYENNNAALLALNEALANLDNTLASLGETMQPINTALLELANDILTALEPYIKDFSDNYLPGIKDALSTVGDKIGEVIGWISDNWDLISTIGTIIGAIAAAILLVNAAMTAYNIVLAIHNALMAPANLLIIAIVAAIAAVIAIIVICVKHWDEIKAKVTEVVDKIKAKVEEMKQKIKDKFEEIKTSINEKLEAIKGFFRGVLDWIKENWLGLILLIVNPFAGAFKLAYDNCEGFRNKVNDFIEKIKQFFKDGFEKVKSNIINPIREAKDKAIATFQDIKDGIGEKIEAAKQKVSDVIEKIKGLFNFSWSLPKLKLPHFSSSGKFSLNPPSVPKISVSWYAKGGVFDKPTLFNYGSGNIGGLGEAGAEAVVPLEKNTKWLDKIAEKLSNNSNNTPVILLVDGKTFAETTISCLNDLTRQRGSLPLKLV